ncbi:MAG: hypothetical protein J0L99_05180 [Chitinophagales bacterium]|nr:hypothetical protein [Chitinophagales bacterium]
MKNTLLFILFLAALSFSACEKEKTPPTELEKLPAATQEGKNTFGCLVDGKAWTPKWGGLLKPALTPHYNNILGSFGIVAVRYDGSEIENVLNLSGEGLSILETGNYSLSFEETSFSLKSETCSTPGPVKNGRILINQNGTIQITRLDVSTGIISGTFEFDAVSETCQDTVRITDGRFDIKYK